jgi:hypothetical protein
VGARCRASHPSDSEPGCRFPPQRFCRHRQPRMYSTEPLKERSTSELPPVDLRYKGVRGGL